MIIVTGSPRSGTSLMMQTLRLLGIPVSGMAFHPEFSNEKLNPGGYWDLPIEETINGIGHDEYSGTAVKLFGAQLAKTDPWRISKIIVCTRNMKDTLPSIKRLVESESWQLEKLGIEPSNKLCEETYDLNYSLIWKYIEESKLEHISIAYEDMVFDPEKEILKLIDFVGRKRDIKEAVDNVRR